MGKIAWFILGLILGAALALVAVTLTGRRDVSAPPPESDTIVVAPPVGRPQPAVPSTVLAPTPPKVIKATPHRAPVSPDADDSQMAEDAAAVGMTSRARPHPADTAPAANSDAAPADAGPG